MIGRVVALEEKVVESDQRAHSWLVSSAASPPGGSQIVGSSAELYTARGQPPASGWFCMAGVQVNEDGRGLNMLDIGLRCGQSLMRGSSVPEPRGHDQS